MWESEGESETSVVASWWVGRLTVGVDACGEMMPPNKAIRPSERRESTWSGKHIVQCWGLLDLSWLPIVQLIH
jgi:hypothetical protein